MSKMSELDQDLQTIGAIMAEPEEGHCACGRHHSNQCDLCNLLVANMGREMGDSAEEQIERKCDWIVRELDELCALASNPETVDLIEAQRIAVGQILTRAQLIAAFLMARKPAPTHIRRVS